MPYNDSHWTFSSCAIVSNSGSLLNSEFGAEIDAHEMITRINHAPISGFQRYVGSRTTFDICNRSDWRGLLLLLKRRVPLNPMHMVLNPEIN